MKKKKSEKGGGEEDDDDGKNNHNHPQQQQQQQQQAAVWKGFASGSLGAMASGAVTHPIDLVKVRMQLYGECASSALGSSSSSSSSSNVKPPGMLRTGAMVLGKEGAFGLYKGLSASLLRQATFIGTKFGTYDVLKATMRKYNNGGIT